MLVCVFTKRRDKDVIMAKGWGRDGEISSEKK